MGRPKLILPVGGRTVLRRVLTALREGGVDLIMVVAPPGDAPESTAVVEEAAIPGVRSIVPDTRPPDMRASFRLGLAALERETDQPTTVLLAPADSPGLTASTVSLVLARAKRDPERIIVPTHGGRRGHPIALPWAVALAVDQLPAGVGVNALVAERRAWVEELPLDDPAVIADLDTPEDYARWADAP